MGTSNRRSAGGNGRRIAIGTGVVGWICAGIACFGPTQVALDLTTDATCRPDGKAAPRTKIFVGPSFGSADWVAETTSCAPLQNVNAIGSFYLVPKDSRSAQVTVHVVMRLDDKDPEDCKLGDPDKQCVIARRIVRFAEHQTKPLPIRLYRACAGLPCTDETTCTVSENAPPRCVNALVPDDRVTCADCTELDAGTDAALETGTPDVVDSGPESSVIDAGPPCPGTDPSGFVATVTPTGMFAEHMIVTADTLVWTVDVVDAPAIYAKELSSGATASLRHTVDGSTSALAADGNTLWVGTTTGLSRILLPSFGADKVVDVESVNGLATRVGGVYMSGSYQNAVGLYEVSAANLAVTERIKSVPGMLLAPRQAGGQLYGLESRDREHQPDDASGVRRQRHLDDQRHEGEVLHRRRRRLRPHRLHDRQRHTLEDRVVRMVDRPDGPLPHEHAWRDRRRPHRRVRVALRARGRRRDALSARRPGQPGRASAGGATHRNRQVLRHPRLGPRPGGRLHLLLGACEGRRAVVGVLDSRHPTWFDDPLSALIRSTTLSRRSHRSRVAWAAGGLAAVLGYAVACFGPTQVRITATTDVPCIAPAPDNRPITTAFYVGAVLDENAEVAAPDTTQCSPEGARNRIGDLVFTPRDDREARVTVHAVLNAKGGNTTDCMKTGLEFPKHCIVARRTFRFFEHDKRDLPIALDQSCLGKFCDPGQTCIGGSCKTDDVDNQKFDDKPGPPDGGGKDDAATIEGGIDTPALACANAPVDVMLLPSASPKLAVNSTTIFYVAAGTDGIASIVGVPIAGGTGSVFFQPLEDPVSALAADDAQLYVGTRGEKKSLTRVELATKTASTIDFPFVTDIVLWQGQAFIARSTGPSAGGAKTLWMHDPSTPPSQLFIAGGPAASGDALAAIRDTLFVLTRGDTGAVQSYPLPWDSTGSFAKETVPAGFGIAAAVPTSTGATVAFMTVDDPSGFPSQTSVKRWAPTSGLPVTRHAQGFITPREIVADPESIYHVAAANGGWAVFHSDTKNPGPGGQTSTALEPATYKQIDAIAHGADCVYVSVQRAKGDKTEHVLRGIPKKKPPKGSTDAGGSDGSVFDASDGGG